MSKYAGIDKSGLNNIASIEAMSRDELVISLNMLWVQNYGHLVIIE